jgi:hypothetical protein
MQFGVSFSALFPPTLHKQGCRSEKEWPFVRTRYFFFFVGDSGIP